MIRRERPRTGRLSREQLRCEALGEHRCQDGGI
jgi:hypothetical protein